MASIIKVEHLSYVYNPGMPNAVTALDDVSFTVEEGDFVGIIGATGSGKSTLITHMNGLNKPTSGKIIIDGRDLWAEPEKIRDFRFLTGLVFQYPEHQLFENDVLSDVCFGPMNQGLSREEAEVEAKKALQHVGFKEKNFSKSPFELSGGQKKRVAIAGVLAMNPKILILDEPTAMLDPNGRKEVLEAVSDLNRREGVTVILITHYMEEVVHADKVYVMDNGEVVMQGTPREIFSQVETLKEYRLDVPQVTLLAHELHKAGVDVSEGILTTEELVNALCQ